MELCKERSRLPLVLLLVQRGRGDLFEQVPASLVCTVDANQEVSTKLSLPPPVASRSPAMTAFPVITTSVSDSCPGQLLMIVETRTLLRQLSCGLRDEANTAPGYT